MKWKWRLIVNLFIWSIVCLATLSLNAQDRLIGIKKPSSANPYWETYSQESKEKKRNDIKKAITLNIGNFSLFEYSFVLDELLQVYRKNAFEQDWHQYMDSLKAVAESNLIGAGLIPLQVQFFHATLLANPELKQQHPEAYKFIQENTPKMEGMGYQPDEYEEILKKYAFSDIVGEGIMLEFLMLKDVKLLETINNNPSLKDHYLLWLENLPDPANNFRFDVNRPVELLSRKKNYLVQKLQQSDYPLAKITWEPLSQVRISRIREPASDSFNNILTGTWQGSYADKEIQIYMNPYSNFAGEDSLRGYNKFTWQSDIKQIAMRGTFEDKGGYFKVKMEEYRVPFQEEPKGKQDVINESWGGPEKFYPHSMSYGIFEFIIDKKTKSMKGTWSSRSGNLVREFEIPKLYQ